MGYGMLITIEAAMMTRREVKSRLSVVRAEA